MKKGVYLIIGGTLIILAYFFIQSLSVIFGI